MTKHFILIDGSYFIFYRYYALVQWWKHVNPDIKLTKPFENNDFVERFISSFKNKLKELPKKLKIDNPTIYVGKDCPRKNIWRNDIYDKYKSNREKDDSFEGGPFFKMVYDENLFLDNGVSEILKLDRLEADDCIAISCSQILSNVTDSKITIIASDHDYSQLASDKISIFTLTYKNLLDSKTLFDDNQKNLFLKIITGDKSDNIPGLFKKCGIKTATKYYEDRNLFNEKCEKEGVFNELKRNTTLVDFRNIPQELVYNFVQKYKQIYGFKNS